MKNLKTYILEASLLNDIDDILADGDVKAPYTLIHKYIESNYHIFGKLTISEKPNKDGLYKVNSDGDIIVKNKQIMSLVNDLFVWDTINGSFDCSNCGKLKSLKGAPKIVNGSFDCSICNSLTTLEGSPEEVGCNFDCSHCESLESLNGCTKIVEGFFSCSFCDSLKSLEGSPKYVRESFKCYNCKSLESFEGCPREVEGNFLFYENKLKISKLKIKIKCRIEGIVLL